jgi:hypothetical protein
MRDLEKPPPWTTHLVYRAERTRTTWTLRLGVATLALTALYLTSGWWTVAIGRSLVCDADLDPSEAILIEDLDPDYLLFERARNLRLAGAAPRVLVAVPTDPDGREPNNVALGITEVMATIARVGRIEFVPIRETEPITLNAARDILRFLAREQIRSVIVVTPLFRSRRSALVNAATLGRAGIVVRCAPAEGSRGVNSWTRSWHGIQVVAEQWLKLQYYRLWVLPFRLNSDKPAPAGGSAAAR